jgi:hypothetical protein
MNEGISRAGDKAIYAHPDSGDHLSNETIVLTWNNYGTSGKVAKKTKEKGGIHLIMENGYFPALHGKKTYSFNFGDLYEDFSITDSASDRLNMFNIALEKPKINQDGYILVCGQMGGNYSPYAMPSNWPNDICKEIRQHTDRKIIFRPHPARRRIPDVNRIANVEIDENENINQSIEGAFCTVVYTSSCSIKSLCQGVPVFYSGHKILGQSFACNSISNINNPQMYDYELFVKYMKMLSWKVWDIDEIKLGEAWTYLKWKTRRIAS